MMGDPVVFAAIAAAALAGLVVIVVAGLRAWQAWLDLQRLAIGTRPPGEREPVATPAARIELADLKERVRKLEAIAAGVDL